MKVTVQGTGSSSGLPTYMCTCEGCTNAYENGIRRRQSMTLLEVSDILYMVDCGFDPLLAGVIDYYQPVAGIFLSHPHLDHVYGLYSPNWRKMRGNEIPVYYPFAKELDGDALDAGFFRLFANYATDRQRFVFEPVKTWESVELPGIKVTCFPLRHDKKDSTYYTSAAWGYLFEDPASHACWAYLCDTLGIDEEVIAFLREKQVDLAIIDATFGCEPARDGHNNFKTALDISVAIGAKQSALTHVNHLSLGESDRRALASLEHFQKEKVVVATDGMSWKL